MTPIAIDAPSPRWMALASLAAVALGSAVMGADSTPPAAKVPAAWELRLEARNNPSSIYYSAWNRGPVVAHHDASDGRAVVYRRDFVWHDGCTWQAVERLTPVDGSYAYHYVEHPVSCPTGYHFFGSPSPRDGIVKVVPLATPRPATPLLGTAEGVSGADLDARAPTRPANTL
jgi:hypothetical protein